MQKMIYNPEALLKLLPCCAIIEHYHVTSHIQNWCTATIWVYSTEIIAKGTVPQYKARKAHCLLPHTFL